MASTTLDPVQGGAVEINIELDDNLPAAPVHSVNSEGDVQSERPLVKPRLPLTQIKDRARSPNQLGECTLTG